LECGVPADDPIIQKAAKYLRSKAAAIDTTYDLSLGILFLDRLGDPKDEKLIQTFALRLIAGQSMTGGWGYRCPHLAETTRKDLLMALRHLDPPLEGKLGKKPGDLAPMEKAPGTGPLGGLAVQPGTPSPFGSIGRGSPGESSSLSGGSLGGSVGELPPPQDTPMESPDQLGLDCLGIGFLESKEPLPPEPDAKAEAEDKAGTSKSTKRYVIPERLQRLPVIQAPALHVLLDPKGKSHDILVTTTDNSNTQFAILALWTAQRHEVPMKRSMNLIVRRFLTSQNADGSWNYHYSFGGAGQHESFSSKGAMTCVGLIGLAVGHGLAQPRQDGRPVQDPRIINGLIALTRNIGQPVEVRGPLPMENLYFLWSLERVAVLYNLPTIGDKDWYRWGAQVLLRNQQQGGSWIGGQYHGSSAVLDTCLALLFLKRANLVKDLTAKLPFKAADLNNDIMKILAPPSSPKTAETPKTIPVAAEPPKPTEKETVSTLPPPPLEDTAKPEPPAVSTDSGKKKWILLSLLLFVLFAGGSLFFILYAVSRRKAEGSEEKPGKRKDSQKKRKLQSAKTDG
jgi:hypothetical protein